MLFENADNIIIFKVSWLLFALSWIVLSFCSMITFSEEKGIYVWSVLWFPPLWGSFLASIRNICDQESLVGWLYCSFFWVHKNSFCEVWQSSLLNFMCISLYVGVVLLSTCSLFPNSVKWTYSNQISSLDVKFLEQSLSSLYTP